MPKPATKRHKANRRSRHDQLAPSPTPTNQYLLFACILLVVLVAWQWASSSSEDRVHKSAPLDLFAARAQMQREMIAKKATDKFGSSQFHENPRAASNNVPEGPSTAADDAEPKRFGVGASVYARLQHGWTAATVLENDNNQDAYKLQLKDGEAVYAPMDTDTYVRQTLTSLDEESTATEELVSKEQTKFELLIVKGIQTLAKDQFKEASVAFREATTIRPDAGQAQFQLGTCLYELAKAAQAAEQDGSEFSDEALLAFEAAANHISPEEGATDAQATQVSALYNAGALT